MPSGLRKKAWRCSGEPCSRRGNQTRGMPRVRPSSRSTHIWASSKRTAVGLGEKVIPGVLKLGAALLDHFLQALDRARVEVAIIGEFHLRRQPELGRGAGTGDVNVNRLERIAFVRKEMKSMVVPAKYDGHALTLPLRGCPSPLQGEEDSLRRHASPREHIVPANRFGTRAT